MFDIQVTEHFVILAVYSAQVGNYTADELKWRRCPKLGWQQGIFIVFTNEKDGAYGWLTCTQVLHSRCLNDVSSFVDAMKQQPSENVPSG